MRQRILIILALATVILGGLFSIVRFGKSDVKLANVSLAKAAWTFDYRQVAEVYQTGWQSTQVREIRTNMNFKGRSSRTLQRFESSVTTSSPKFFVGGVEAKAEGPVLVYSDLPHDFRNRLMVGGFRDPYPLEMLNTMLFFPFLSGRVTEVGEEWEDQFRVILPVENQQMIAVLRTRLADVKSTREAIIEYELHGEAMYTLSTKKREKAVLSLKGTCSWDALVALPNSQSQEMVLRFYDLDLIRKADPRIKQFDFAETGFRKTSTQMVAISKGVTSYGPTKTSTQTGAGQTGEALRPF